jgi:branched-chain amino acid transport system substrate-binding protein
VFLNYQSVYLLVDAIERAKSAKREDIIAAMEKSTWDKHFMPYGPTKFVNGQNTGAAPVTLQVQKGDIKVIMPNTLAEAAPVFPWKA